MVSSAFTPIHSLVGGLMMAGSVSGMLGVLGQVLGISGMYHRSIDLLLAPLRPAAPGPRETKVQQSVRQARSTAVLFTSGLILGGAVLGLFRGPLEAGLGIRLFDPPAASVSLTTLALWGALVGFGTRWGCGCTSGHFLCGLGRLSRRSIVATGTFFSVAVGTHLLVTRGTAEPLPSNVPVKLPSLRTLAWLQLPLLGYVVLPALFAHSTGSSESATLKKQTALADLASFTTGVHFAFGLALTGMLRPSKVLGFLSLSPSRMMGEGWDPSLAFVALGGILPSAAYFFGKISERVQRQRGAGEKSKDSDAPLLDAACPLWRLPTTQQLDLRLIIGSAIFGIGWGLSGACPGPILVNWGAALVGGVPAGGALTAGSVLVLAMAVGGQLAATV